MLAGALSVACAVGIRRALHPGRAGTWGPLLVGTFGVGLIAGGVFLPTPPSASRPAPPRASRRRSAGTPPCINFAPGLALDAAIVASFVFARRFAGLRERGWVAYCAACGLAILVLSWWPDLDGISVRLAVAVAVALRMGGSDRCPAADRTRRSGRGNGRMR